MSQKPIVFSAEMVRAIMSGNKTQTRRIIKQQPPLMDRVKPVWNVKDDCDLAFTWPWTDSQEAGTFPPEELSGIKCPYGKLGDVLWVRESFYIDLLPYSERGTKLPATPTEEIRESIYYLADGECCEQIPECQCCEVGKPYWRSPIYMPRWASRITLKINGIRVQRVQDISNKDAMFEGLQIQVGEGTGPGSGYKWNGIGYWGGSKDRFGKTYHVNVTALGPCGCKVGERSSAVCAYREIFNRLNGDAAWESNPWVWAITFEVHK